MNNFTIYNSEEEFKLALFKHFNVMNNAKKQQCYDLAWDYGHSSGYSEVYNYFYDLVELIR